MTYTIYKGSYLLYISEYKEGSFYKTIWHINTIHTTDWILKLNSLRKPKIAHKYENLIQ